MTSGLRYGIVKLQMKKLAFIGSAITALLTPIRALAAPTPIPDPDRTIQIGSPIFGFTTLGNAIANIITLAFAIAVLAVLVMLILGAFEWIVSGGDKEAVGKARNRILNALIGLAVLAIAFALVKVFGSFVGLNLTNITVPTPNPSASGL